MQAKIKCDPLTVSDFESRLQGMFDEDIATGKRLFFVQGLWRSGTSWVGRMLDSEPRTYVCGHELQSYLRLLRITQNGEPLESNPFVKTRLDAGRKAGFLSILLHFQRVEKPNALRIGERSPGADVVALKAAFPESKIVIVLRDGRDACVSQAFLDKKTGAIGPTFEEGSPFVIPAYAALQALNYSRYIPEYLSLKDAYPDDVLLVRYEDLRRHPVDEMSRVFAGLQVGIDREGVESICRRHSFENEVQEAAQPDRDGVWLRRGEVGNWTRHLSPLGLSAYEDVAGRALDMAGYPRSQSSTPERAAVGKAAGTVSPPAPTFGSDTTQPGPDPGPPTVPPASAVSLDSRLSGLFGDRIATGRGLFFVHGLWCSGTSWLCGMLNDEPHTYVCRHELQGFMRMLDLRQQGRRLDSNPFLKTRLDLGRKAGFLAMLSHLHASEKPGATLIGETSPGADAAQLKEAFPYARQVILLRDGRDICASSAHLASRTGADQGSVDLATGKVALGYTVTQALLYSVFVSEYFALKAVYPRDVMLIRYEDLVEHPVVHLQQIFQFLDLEVSLAEAEVIGWRHNYLLESGRTLEDEGVHPSTWREQLSPDGVAMYEAIAGQSLLQAGYTPSGIPASEPFPAKAGLMFGPVLHLLEEFERELKASAPQVSSPGIASARRLLWVAGEELLGGRLDFRKLIDELDRATARTTTSVSDAPGPRST